MRLLKLYLPFFAVGLLILISLPYLIKPKEDVIILMKKDTFEPGEIEIKKGTKVIFKNEDQGARWPASNLHPTHGIYPEFDPREPVETGEVWSFVFEESGSFKYHDHLIPSIRGTITVTRVPQLSF